MEPRNRGNRDPPSAITAATVTEKIQGFAPESVFKPEFTRSRFLTLPNYFHHDVVAMMIANHHGEKASHDTFVIRKFPA
jgi:hypothetical protein